LELPPLCDTGTSQEVAPSVVGGTAPAGGGFPAEAPRVRVSPHGRSKGRWCPGARVSFPCARPGQGVGRGRGGPTLWAGPRSVPRSRSSSSPRKRARAMCVLGPGRHGSRLAAPHAGQGAAITPSRWSSFSCTSRARCVLAVMVTPSVVLASRSPP